MPQHLDGDAVAALHETIAEHDELISTRYTWEGEYAITVITLRRHVGPPGGARPVDIGPGPALTVVPETQDPRRSPKDDR